MHKIIHNVDPYEGFDYTKYPKDVHGWHSEEPIFEELIKKTNPRNILEVGTWKGASAIHMARVCKTLGMNTHITCIDTWLGFVEAYNGKDTVGTGYRDSASYSSLKLVNGYPTLYYQFLANVCHEGFSSSITPFALPSVDALRFLNDRAQKYELIYVDASHHYPEAFWDLDACIGLISPGGIIFGDDFTTSWPGVMQSVKEFCTKHGKSYQVIDNNFYVIQI